MGLDSYLNGERYLGSQHDNRILEGSLVLTAKSYADTTVKTEEIPLKDISSIEYSIGYWRKASHIHNWFVENVQNGTDDCGRYYVSKSKLKELLDVCKKVMKKKSLAEELLPPAEGFFFGGTEMDEYYFEAVKDTIDIVEVALKFEGGLYYQASW